MKLFLAQALAAAVVAGGAWLTPGAAVAQNYDRNWDPNQGQPYQNQGPYRQSQNNQRQNRNYNQNQNGATAWGDPWLNENDFDYNRRHWLPNRADEDRNRGYSGDNRYRGTYGNGQDNWNQQGYSDNRYDQRYRPNDNRLGGYYDRDRGYNRYDDDDE